MFRPMIYAPMPSPKRLAKSLSGPVVPPVLPFISRNARVPMYQPCSSSPPTPSGSFSPWRGPAPYPSSEIAKLWTRSLDMESSAGFICVEWAVPKSTGEELVHSFFMSMSQDSLGLESGTVRLVEYDDRWPFLFRAEAARILAAASELQLTLEHVGSTAVPGLCAKPVLDILAGYTGAVPALAYVAPLERAGYEHS